MKRAERTPSIVAADRIAGTLGLTLAALFAELEREPDHQAAVDPRAGIKVGKGPRVKDEAMEERSTFCPRCRHGNPRENRFCGACGSPLASGELPARRPESSPTTASRGLLPAELKPVGRALAVGLAALAAEAGLAWLRRRAGGSDRPSLPATRGTEPAILEHPVYQSFEEVHVLLREGGFESQMLAQLTMRSLRTTNPTNGRR